MKCKTKIFLTSSLILISLLLFLAFSKAETIDSDTYFIIDNYNTYINFASTQTFSNIEAMASYLMIDSYYFIVENGNITFTNWLTETSLKLSTSWSSGGTTTLWLNGSSPVKTPYKITYLTIQPAWYWIGTNNTLKLEITNPNTIEIFWTESGAPPNEPPPGSEPIVIPSTEIPDIPPAPIPVTTILPFLPRFPHADQIYLGIAVISGSVIFLMAQKRKRRSFRKFGLKYKGVGSSYRGKVNLNAPKISKVRLKIKKSKLNKLKRGDTYE